MPCPDSHPQQEMHLERQYRSLWDLQVEMLVQNFRQSHHNLKLVKVMHDITARNYRRDWILFAKKYQAGGMDTEHHKSKISVSMHMHTCSNPEHRCHAIWMGLKCNEKSMQKESHCHLLFFGGTSQEHLGRKMQTVGIIMLVTSAYSPKASFLGQIHSAKGFTGIKVWQNA